MKQTVSISSCHHRIQPWADPNVCPPVENSYTAKDRTDSC